LKELAAKQEENSKENNLQAQEEINKKFSDIKSDLDETEKKDQLLENPQGFKSPEEKEKAIDDKLKEASQNLQKNSKSKANEAQKDASKKMEEMADTLEEMQQEGEEEQNNIDE